MNLNKVTLIGRIGKDPETRYLDENTPVSKTTLAASETYAKNGEKHEETEWFNLVFWRGLAKVVDQYVKKGDLIYVEGKIKTRSYEDKEGVKKICLIPKSYKKKEKSKILLGRFVDNPGSVIINKPTHEQS